MDSTGLFIGLIFIAIAFIAMTMIGSKETKVTFTDKAKFIQEVSFAMIETGYKSDIISDDFMSFTPTMKAGLASGAATIRIYENYALIKAHRTKISKILRLLK
jgi:hypothetical protein